MATNHHPTTSYEEKKNPPSENWRRNEKYFHNYKKEDSDLTAKKIGDSVNS